METNTQNIKKIVREELPGLMKRDKKIREFILKLTKEQFKEVNDRSEKIEKKMDDRFDRLLDELRIDREEQNRKWEENQKEIRKLYHSIENLYNKQETTIGALGTRWGLRSEASFRNALKGILKNLEIEVTNVNSYPEELGKDIAT